MRQKLLGFWQMYSNLFLCIGGKKGDAVTQWMHRWWNTPLGEFFVALATALRDRFLPRLHLPEAPQLTNRQYRLRVLLMLSVSAVAYGCMNGFHDMAMLFVGIPFLSVQHPGSAEAGNFYLGLSIFTAAMVHKVLYRLFLGREEAPLRSVNGMMLFLMDLLLLNVVDGGVMALSLLVDGVPNAAVRYLLQYLALCLALMIAGELSGNFIAVWISFAAAKIMALLGTATYYLCLPLILLARALNLSGIFPLEFFYSLCIVLITLGISMLLERFGVIAWLQKLCARLSAAKVFFLLLWVLLPLAPIIAPILARVW